MRILICGAHGFIGRHIVAALRAQGRHQLVLGQSPRQRLVAAHEATAATCTCDFGRDVSADVWVPRLRGIDLIINAVGLLRARPGASLEAVHARTPMALMDACVQAGVRHFIQISALGIAHSPTDYAVTKRTADEHALALRAQGRLQAVVVRPSVVFGPGAPSSDLFTMLSHSPVLLLPRPVMQARVQPVAVGDLAVALAHVIDAIDKAPAMLQAVGPRALRLGELIASLRQQAGRAPARTWPLPDTLTRWSARVGDAIPGLPWCRTTLSLLSEDNVAPPDEFARWLGRPGVPPERLLQAHQSGVATSQPHLDERPS